jgi:hypothetical protein
LRDVTFKISVHVRQWENREGTVPGNVPLEERNICMQEGENKRPQRKVGHFLQLSVKLRHAHISGLRD